jgi:hypothetical protein
MKGRKDDSLKERWDLLPVELLEVTAKVLTHGARKYGANNWKQVENLKERYYSALLRHLVAWRKGEHCDQETGLHHFGHIMCCLLFIYWKELNDTIIHTKPKTK